MKAFIKLTLLAAIFMILVLPHILYAQTANPQPAVTRSPAYNFPNYFAMKLGAYFPQEKWDVLDLGVFEYSLDTGFNGELAFGRYFNRNWAIEIGTGYFQATGDDTFFGTKSKSSVDVMPLTVALKGIIPADRFEIYGIGGIGAYFLWADEKLNGISFSDEDILFGGFLGAGISYNITPSVFLGLEGKYLWTQKASLSDSLWRQKHSLDGWFGTFNIGFRF